MIKIWSSILRIICTILYPLNSNIIPCNILLMQSKSVHKNKDIQDTLKTLTKRVFFPEAKPNKQVKRAYVSTYSIL